MRESFWLQGMQAGFPAACFCIKAFSETDLTEDLKKIDVPTLILHGDQIVPYADSGPLSAKLLENGTLKTYKGFPHGMPTAEPTPSIAKTGFDLAGSVRSCWRGRH